MKHYSGFNLSHINAVTMADKDNKVVVFASARNDLDDYLSHVFTVWAVDGSLASKASKLLLGGDSHKFRYGISSNSLIDTDKDAVIFSFRGCVPG